jgi:secondary thiamine-phosphate synthase enzyme
MRGEIPIWKEISLTTLDKSQFIEITAQVALEVTHSGIKNGFCTLFVPHTTAGITINENTDPNVIRDMLGTLERLVPETVEYRHAEGNSDAHVKASLIGSSCTVPIISGQIHMGTWQGIYFCEFDGPRNRKLKVGLFGEKEN